MAVAMAVTGCSESLAPINHGDAGADVPVAISLPMGDVVETAVNASSSDAWIYFDLEQGNAVTVGDPAAATDWDLGFQRFKIKSNGGLSGGAGVEVALLPNVSLADVTRAPKEGWVVDLPDGDDENMDPDFAFNAGDGWYSYDPATHALAARQQTYVVLTKAGHFFAVQMLKYYDDAGTSGFVRFQWKPIESPEGDRTPASPYEPGDGGAPEGGGSDAAPDAGVDAANEEVAPPADLISVSAPSSAAWIYLKADGALVTPVEPATAPEWDLAFSRTLVRTNSGTSGAGMGGARLAEAGAAYDAISAAPADGYEVDKMVPNAGPPGSGEHSGNPVLEAWYDYDPVTHATPPRKVVFFLRTAAGGHAKLQIHGYKDGTYQLRLGTLP